MRQKEYKPLPEKHLWQLALHTGQWCRAVLCQAHRFFDALEADNRPLPWDDSESFDMLLADKTFLITAIHHSIVNMEKLNAELINRGDTSFQGVLDSIATAEERKQIRIWRNMNEHDLDFLMWPRLIMALIWRRYPISESFCQMQFWWVHLKQLSMRQFHWSVKFMQFLMSGMKNTVFSAWVTTERPTVMFQKPLS